MTGLLILALITTFQPARPTVGDPVTLQFAAPTTVDPSPDYEVVSRSGDSVVIRAFVARAITVTGHAADGPVSVVIPIHSVLKSDDKLEPAPLKPPIPEPWPRMPFAAIGIAALAAGAAWTAVVLLARRRATEPHVVVVPAERFRARVQALRRIERMRWAQLADAVRAYLAEVRDGLGAELTTSEVLSRIEAIEAADRQTAAEPAAVQPPSPFDPAQGRRRRYVAALVAAILRQGDLEKFSPWGAAYTDFDDALNHALEIPTWAEPPAPAAEEQAA